MKTEDQPARHVENDSFGYYVFGKKDLENVKKDANDRIRRDNEKIFLSKYFNANAENIFFLMQEHSDKIFRIDGSSSLSNGSTYYGTGDAMYTETPGLLLCIRTADCLPVFFTATDNGRRLAGIIHAGWRGLNMGIVRKTILQAQEECGYRPEHFSVFYGPSAGGRQYRVQEDVAKLFTVKTKNPDNSYMLDLRKNAMLELDKYHHISNDFFDCTMERNNLFYSHRMGDVERNLNVIFIRN